MIKGALYSASAMGAYGCHSFLPEETPDLILHKGDVLTLPSCMEEPSGVARGRARLEPACSALSAAGHCPSGRPFLGACPRE